MTRWQFGYGTRRSAATARQRCRRSAHQFEEDPDSGRLPGAVRAKEAEDLVYLYRQ